MTEDFMALTLDVWDIPSESARRVGHPAPFPVELPEQLIRLYTFANDLVLDPFMGSGSALVAAAQLGRRYAGYDLDPGYVEIARRRVAEITPPPVASEAGTSSNNNDDDFQSRAKRAGKVAHKLAEEVLTDAGFTVTERNRRMPKTGVTVNFVATDKSGEPWYFDVSGAFKTHRGGLVRTDAVWRSLGRANALRDHVARGVPLVFLTTHLPRHPSEGDTALHSAGPLAFFDAIEMLSDDGRARLELYAKGGFTGNPQPGFWTEADLARRNP